MAVSKKIIPFAMLVLTTPTLATTNHIPQPWRADAVTEGRDVDYSIDWFLQSFSFAHLQDRPSATENGLRGTGGSVTSNHLYYDFRLRQELNYDDSQHGFLLDIQRSEDFDGAFDRQLVGLKFGLTEHAAFWLQGDVFADKSLADIYFSGRHQFTSQNYQHTMQASLILTDAYFNDKTSGDDRLIDEPATLFLQWQGANLHLPGHTSLVSLSYTPSTSIDSRSNKLFVESESLQGAFSWRIQEATWQAGFDIEAELSDRQYILDGDQPAGKLDASPDFKRNSVALTARYRLLSIHWQPEAGLHYSSLNERGYFGRRSNQYGRIKRREPMLFMSGTVLLSPRQRLKPTIYLGLARIEHEFSDPEWKNRDDKKFIGKFSLPWRYVVSAESGAVLSIVLSTNLHEAAFGGGNVQFHWPFN